MRIPNDVRELIRAQRDENDALEVGVWNKGGVFHVAWTRANGSVAAQHPAMPTFDTIGEAFAHGFKVAKHRATKGEAS